MGRLGRDLGPLPAHDRYARDRGCLRPELAAEACRRTNAQVASPTLPDTRFTAFDRLIDAWFPLTYVLNNLNRGMGLPDGYPFVLSPPAVEKLKFVHETLNPASTRDESAVLGIPGQSGPLGSLSELHNGLIDGQAIARFRHDFGNHPSRFRPSGCSAFSWPRSPPEFSPARTSWPGLTVIWVSSPGMGESRNLERSGGGLSGMSASSSAARPVMTMASTWVPQCMTRYFRPMRST